MNRPGFCRGSIVLKHGIERVVRMVSEAASEYSSQWAAIESIAAKIGCTPEFDILLQFACRQLVGRCSVYFFAVAVRYTRLDSRSRGKDVRDRRTALRELEIFLTRHTVQSPSPPRAVQQQVCKFATVRRSARIS